MRMGTILRSATAPTIPHIMAKPQFFPGSPSLPQGVVIGYLGSLIMRSEPDQGTISTTAWRRHPGRPAEFPAVPPDPVARSAGSAPLHPAEGQAGEPQESGQEEREGRRQRDQREIQRAGVAAAGGAGARTGDLQD